MSIAGRSLVLQAVIGAVVAVGVVSIVVLVARALGEDFKVAPPGQPVSELPLAAFAIATLVATLVGFVVALICRRLGRPRPVFVALAVLGTLLSLVNPFLSAERQATAIWLSATHLVVAAILIPALASALAGRREPTT